MQALDSSSRSNSPRERGSPSRSYRRTHRPALWRRLRRIRAARRLTGRTSADSLEVGPGALGVTRSNDQYDRSADNRVAAEFRNLAQIPRLSARTRGLQSFFSLDLWT